MTCIDPLADTHHALGHCIDLPLEDGAPGRTPDGRCRRCQRARQVLWTHTPKGQETRARYDESAQRYISRMRYEDNRAIRVARANLADLG